MTRRGKLAELLRRIADWVQGSSGPSTTDVHEREVEQGSPVSAPNPGQVIIEALRTYYRWLWRHPVAISSALVILAGVFFLEARVARALAAVMASLASWWPMFWAAHRFAVDFLAVLLFFLVFGWIFLLGKLAVRAWQLGKEHIKEVTVVTGVVLALLVGLIWAEDNRGKWVVGRFDVGEVRDTSLDGDLLAVHLIAELAKVGSGTPPPAFALLKAQEPFTTSGSVLARRALTLNDNECEAVMEGPGDFTIVKTIPLPRLEAGSGGSTLDLGNVSVGPVNIPSSLLSQSALRLLPISYREFSGRINETSDGLQVNVDLRNPNTAWIVAGPREALPEMMDYLALRIALDLNPELVKSAGLASPVSDADLAYNLGLRQFRLRIYESAKGYFEIADRFSRLRPDIDAMLGLTLYHLSLQEGAEGSGQLEEALSLLKASVAEDPTGEGSLLRPYLACVYRTLGLNDQADRELGIFNGYLRALESRGVQARIDALRDKPLRGPNRHIAVEGGRVVYADLKGNVVGVETENSNVRLHVLASLGGGRPREILFASDTTLLLVAADGEILSLQYPAAGEPGTTNVLVEGPALRGVQEAMVSESLFARTNVFLLNRFGQVYWCKSDLSLGACAPQLVDTSAAGVVRQLFSVDDKLLLLSTDGSVWSSELDATGQASALRQVTAPAPILEIATSGNGALYLLGENGNLYRYFEDALPSTEDLKLVDPGTGTNQIFSIGDKVYILKNDGALWRLDDSPGVDPSGLSQILDSGPSPAQEIYAAKADEGNRVLYGLAADGTIASGPDGDVVRLELQPLRETGETPEPQPTLPEAASATPQVFASIQEVRLLYASAAVTGNNEIITARPDGSDARPLTSSPVSEQAPSLCSDNQKIAFVAVEHAADGDVDSIWMMDSDGANRISLAAEPGVAYETPSWSPGCRYLSYSKRSPRTTRWQVVVLDFQDPFRHETSLVEGRYASWWPRSEQGFQLVYASRGFFLSSVDVSQCPAGTAGQPSECQGSLLTKEGIQGAYPAISPDGTMVAYASVIKSDEQPEDFNQDVYVYNLVDGGEPLRLTAEAERVQGDGFPQDWRPAWSPDGTRIYFESNRSGNPDVWAIDPTGANPTRITFQPTGQTTPTLGYQDALLRAP